jgi:hypothetical protein
VTPSDQRALDNLTLYTHNLDSILFPECPIRTIAIMDEPPPRSTHCYLVVMPPPDGAHYRIHRAGLDHFCKDHWHKQFHQIPEITDPDRCNGIIPYTFQEALLQLCIYLVRLRVVHFREIELITPQDVCRLPRCRQFGINLMDEIARLTDDEDPLLMYDARFVSAYLTYEARRGRNLSPERIRVILEMMPSTLPDIESSITGT